MGTNMSRGLMTSEELLEQTLRTRAEARLAFSHDPAESFGALTHRPRRKLPLHGLPDVRSGRAAGAGPHGRVIKTPARLVATAGAAPAAGGTRGGLSFEAPRET